jgi:hypothetical protein
MIKFFDNHLALKNLQLYLFKIFDVSYIFFPSFPTYISIFFNIFYFKHKVITWHFVGLILDF